MKTLIVCSKNSGKVASFIMEQVDALNEEGVDTSYFTIERKGWIGYLKSRRLLLKKIKEFNPDIIHAHYGLSGLLANLQRSVPVVTTYHGSDINNNKVFRVSQFVIKLSQHNIFVSHKNLDKAKVNKNYSLIPCGIDTTVFYPQDTTSCREKKNMNSSKKYALFSGAFDNKVKNSELALKVVENIKDCSLLELKGHTREEVALLMNAVDVCVMTSFTEGSPQFIKEAMACNCPIVSVDVGDVKEIIGDTEGCFISSYDEEELTSKLQQSLELGARTKGRDRIEELGLDTETIAKRIKEIYCEVINSRRM